MNTLAGDDVAVPRSQGALTGRRGLAATVLVYKVSLKLACPPVLLML